MTWVKICGITNVEDAQVVAEAGANALGFVFYEKSPRKIGVEDAREIVAKLPGQVEKVGVFVNGSGFQPADVARQVGLTAIQNTLALEPSADPETGMVVAMAGFARPLKVFLAIPASCFFENVDGVKGFAARFSRLIKDSAARYPGYAGRFDTFFLDAGTPAQPGGTGKTFDWKKAVPIAESMLEAGLKLVVAGGLRPDNVGEALRILKPWGVDVSSGVEAKPGKKDPEKVRAFISAVRKADKIA